jgi:hypothetical protein
MTIFGNILVKKKLFFLAKKISQIIVNLQVLGNQVIIN